MSGIFSFGKNDLGHAAAYAPPQINAGKIADPIEAQPFNGLGCRIQGYLTLLVLPEQIL